VVHRAHVEERRRAPEQQLGEPEAGRCAQRVGVVSLLEGPDAFLEPWQQCPILGDPTEQHLAEVDMGLHKAGADDVAGDVDDTRAGGGDDGTRGPEGLDAAIFHQHVADEDPVAGVDGDDGATCEQDCAVHRVPPGA
jgi:hypothetical protein